MPRGLYVYGRNTSDLMCKRLKAPLEERRLSELGAENLYVPLAWSLGSCLDVIAYPDPSNEVTY